MKVLAALGAVAVAVFGVQLAVGDDAQTPVTAELRDARGLVEGAHVRVAGAVAGRVEDIRLSDRGTALVQLRLHDGLPPLRSDAAASVRPVDLLGDVVLDLSSGRAAEPLRRTIPVARTSSAPRLDEVVSILREPERAGLQALLVEGGRALAGRGDALPATLAELRPALRATTSVLRELGASNARLSELVRDAERTVGALEARRGDVGRLLGGLERSLSATDRRRAELDRGLAGLPALLIRMRTTAGSLGATARAAQPLARDLRDQAAPLAGALRELRPFVRRLRGASGDLRPALAALRGVLRDGAPAFAGLASGFAEAATVAAPLESLMQAVEPAAAKISEGFFVNFADQGAEPGNQPFDPFADPRRGYWRGAAVMSCEAFGVKVEPGCLARVLGASSSSKSGNGKKTAPAPAATKPKVELPAPVRDAVEKVLPPRPAQPNAVGKTVDHLLEFLLGGGG